jgi:hypothetical protein
MNNELKRMLKEAVVPYFEEIKKTSLRMSSIWRRFEPGTF